MAIAPCAAAGGTAAGVARALRRGPFFFAAGRCGTRPQAATQLVGAVALGLAAALRGTAVVRNYARRATTSFGAVALWMPALLAADPPPDLVVVDYGARAGWVATGRCAATLSMPVTLSARGMVVVTCARDRART